MAAARSCSLATRATEEPSRRVVSALEAAADEVGVEWAAYFDLTAR